MCLLQYTLCLICPTHMVLGLVCLLWSGPCAQVCCLHASFLSRFSFRTINLVSSFFFFFIFVLFSFLYSNLIVSLFLSVKPDLTSHVIKIIRIDRSSQIFIFNMHVMFPCCIFSAKREEPGNPAPLPPAVFPLSR